MRRHVVRLLSTISWAIFCSVIVAITIRLESMPLVERFLENIQGSLDIKFTNGVMLIILILNTIVSIMLAKHGKGC
jgi:hypothetical protein